jgi:hypothetical protein
MRASDFDIPAGQPFHKVRDFLLRNDHPRLFDSKDVTEYFSADITAELLAKGLIEPALRYEGKFQISSLGTRLAAKRLMPRIPRTKAEKIVADMLARARVINDTPELLCRISRITAFGSFLTDAEDLGDIDVAVEVKRKDIDDWSDAAVARAKASGRQLDYSQMLSYPEREVKLLLKDRNRYIQFCSPIMLEDFDTPKRVIFSDETDS